MGRHAQLKPRIIDQIVFHHVMPCTVFTYSIELGDGVQYMYDGRPRMVLIECCASPNVDVELLQVAYQPLLQTLSKRLLTSVRFRYLIP